MVLALITTLMSAYSSSSARDILLFLLILVFLVLRPEGLAGKKAQRI
jgi:branched-subunit amino acid ABC-type transport system permease component